MRPSRAKDYKIQTAPKIIERREIVRIKGVPAELGVELCHHIRRYGIHSPTPNQQSYRIGIVDLELTSRSEGWERVYTLKGGDWSIIFVLKQGWQGWDEFNLVNYKIENKNGWRRDMTVIKMFGSKCGDWELANAD